MASSVIVISAKAFGTNIIPTRKIPKSTGKNVFLVILYFDWRTNKSDLGSFVSEFFNFDQIKVRTKL